MNAMMRTVSASALALLVCASASHAQAIRTWVSQTGDDVNPCNWTNPCKTFAGAISKTAPGGIINVITPGSYGPVTITKPLTIEAEQFAGISAGGFNGITINAGPTAVVTIRGLTIDGNGSGFNGIRLMQAKQVHIENCTIQNFTNRGIFAENTSNGIQLFVRNTVIRNNMGAATPAGNSGGILLRPSMTGSVSALLDHVSVDQNIFGLRVEGNSRATVSDSTLSGNVTSAVHATTAGPGAASVILEGVTISNNATGVLVDGSALASVRMSNTMITSNSAGLSTAAGGQILSWGTNAIAGNGVDGNPTSAVTPLK